MIKYIGSKKKLIPNILEIVNEINGIKTIIDLFSGTSRVGYALKQNGYCVFSNDYSNYAHTIATALVQANKEDYTDLQDIIDDLNNTKPIDDWFTEYYSIKSKFFQPFNASKIEGIRNKIEEMNLSFEYKSILLTSLMLAADKIDCTVGIQMAYLKNWSARSYNKIELKVPDLLNQSQYGKSMAYKMNALDASKEIIADAAYLDPPYNQHSYLGNYHVWETLVLWDRPDIYGVACKRLDTKAKKSNFNFKNNAKIEMAQVINNLNCNSLIISFNNEGFISSEEMITMLKGYKEVKIYEYDYKRYVGAQIGIYNPSGELSGEISHLRNKEYIFVATGRNKLNG